ncbi:thiamine biosynthesis protein [Streptomyces tateyamensis]|uniref:FAD:protein FMN transferase n=1 Tax=Streptomyces tateyamensis TaxID=565073 RepID=A0A2V4MX18_9ACTN|nr:FAD:protein FMN transferase [Streptomyces tateyamensis]PYC74018.1 thiamine biosynthesis protein [Streptomyces tateyamensis]
MLRHTEQAMGTVFSFAVRGGPAGALAPAVAELHRLDGLFSTYRPQSQLSRLGRGELTVDQCDPLVAEALAHCAAVRARSGGFFTERPGGRLDLSGWVKGWAVERASDLLTAAGCPDHTVTGGGDVQARGTGPDGQPWRVGVADPARPQALAAVLAGSGAFAVATSGTAERGAHIVDPVAGRPAGGALSVTVVGPRLALTDAYATAAFAMGPHRALDWVTALAGHEALVVLPDGRRLGTPGLARHLAQG